jgi:hypothetical protein
MALGIPHLKKPPTKKKTSSQKIFPNCMGGFNPLQNISRHRQLGSQHEATNQLTPMNGIHMCIYSYLKIMAS